MGIPLAFGCDVPASLFQDPRYAFLGSVLRKTSTGVTYNEEQKLTMQEALRIHTMGSAYTSFSDSLTGSLEPGKYADLVVWSEDLYSPMTPAQASNLKSIMTIVNGEVEYDAGILQRSGNIAGYGFMLEQNFPNPFRTRTRIDYRLQEESRVSLKVYNIMGQEIGTLAEGKQAPGNHHVEFISGDLPDGHYIYRLMTPGHTEVKMMSLIR